jgi:limonene-1,2-epoxide hydrolase
MRPKELVENWVAAFNRGDADALAELYAADAVIHQMPNEPVAGRDAIRAMFEREFAATRMVCQVEYLFEDGEWAILEWRDPLGMRGCGFFHVVDDRIVLQRGYWDELSFLKLHGLTIDSGA